MQEASSGCRRPPPCGLQAAPTTWRQRAFGLREGAAAAAERDKPAGCDSQASHDVQLRIVVGAAAQHAGTSARTPRRPPTRRQRRNDALAGPRARALTGVSGQERHAGVAGPRQRCATAHRHVSTYKSTPADAAAAPERRASGGAGARAYRRQRPRAPRPCRAMHWVLAPSWGGNQR
jgi:hypothetical protein